MKKRIVLSLGLATAIFTGCGSSSSGDNSGNTKTNTGTGYYIDSAISGVDYVCGSKTGKTGSNGSFTFEKGKNCTFSLGSMKLREVKATSLKDQIKVLEDNLAVATLLQTLDSDGNPDNDGIVISSNILAELKAKNITTLPTNQDDVAEIYEVIKNVEGYKGRLKTKEEAQTHLDGGSNPNNLNDLKFTTNWLNGRTLYNVFNDGVWEIAIFEFTNTHLSFYSENDTNNKTTIPYTITDDGKIRFDNPWPDDNVEFAYIAATGQTNDYLEEGSTERYYFIHQKAKDFVNSQ